MKLKEFLRSPKVFKIITTILFGICLIMLGLYFIFVDSSGFSKKSNEWANFGQYFGSITGLLAFAGVLYSAALSEEKAKKAQEEAVKNEERAIKAEEESKRREERDQFFKLLDLYFIQSGIINEKEYSNRSGSVKQLRSDLRQINKALCDKVLQDAINNLTLGKLEELRNLDFQSPDLMLINKFIESYDCVCETNKPDEGDTPDQVLEKNLDFVKINYSNLYGIYGEEYQDISEVSILYKYINSNLPSPYYLYKSLKVILVQKEEYFRKNITYYKTLKLIVETTGSFVEAQTYFELLMSQISQIEKCFIVLFSILDQDNDYFVKLLIKSKIFEDIDNSNFAALVIENSSVQEMFKSFLEFYLSDLN